MDESSHSKIHEHMEVIGADGEHVGVVDRIEGERIKLTKSDPAAQGMHRFIPLSDVTSVEDGVVFVGSTLGEVMADDGPVHGIPMQDVRETR